MVAKAYQDQLIDDLNAVLLSAFVESDIGNVADEQESCIDQGLHL